MFTRITQIYLGLVLAIGLTSGASGEGMDAPTGGVLLTVSGEITAMNADQSLVLDRELLMALPVTTFETSTIWTDGVHSFHGVSFADLVAEIGAEGATLLATAINDYTVEIPASDAVEGGPIIAYLMDGEEMSVRDKGPLWVIYPYDSDAAYQSELVYSRSIWQLDRLEVVE